MVVFYLTGYVIVFILLLLVGIHALVYDSHNEIDTFSLLLSLIIYPFFSWLLIFALVVFLIFYHFKNVEIVPYLH